MADLPSIREQQLEEKVAMMMLSINRLEAAKTHPPDQAIKAKNPRAQELIQGQYEKKDRQEAVKTALRDLTTRSPLKTIAEWPRYRSRLLDILMDVVSDRNCVPTEAELQIWLNTETADQIMDIPDDIAKIISALLAATKIDDPNDNETFQDILDQTNMYGPNHGSGKNKLCNINRYITANAPTWLARHTEIFEGIEWNIGIDPVDAFRTKFMKYAHLVHGPELHTQATQSRLIAELFKKRLKSKHPFIVRGWESTMRDAFITRQQTCTLDNVFGYLAERAKEFVEPDQPSLNAYPAAIVQKQQHRPTYPSKGCTRCTGPHSVKSCPYKWYQMKCTHCDMLGHLLAACGKVNQTKPRNRDQHTAPFTELPTSSVATKPSAHNAENQDSQDMQHNPGNNLSYAPPASVANYTHITYSKNSASNTSPVIIDTGASHHFVNDPNKVVNFRAYKVPVPLATAGAIDNHIIGEGQAIQPLLTVYNKVVDVPLKNARVVPTLTKTLISPVKLTRDTDSSLQVNNGLVDFRVHQHQIKTSIDNAVIVAEAPETRPSLCTEIGAHTADVPLTRTGPRSDHVRMQALYHARYGHSGLAMLKRICETSNTPLHVTEKNQQHCEICIHAKMTRRRRNRKKKETKGKGTTRKSPPIHPRSQSRGGLSIDAITMSQSAMNNKYVVIGVDLATNYTWLVPTKGKSSKDLGAALDQIMGQANHVYTELELGPTLLADNDPAYGSTASTRPTLSNYGNDNVNRQIEPGSFADICRKHKINQTFTNKNTST